MCVAFGDKKNYLTPTKVFVYSPCTKSFVDHMASTNHPTPAELEILDILWELKKGTVRDVYEVISSRKSTAYTTVLKLLQIMQAKGLVVRDVKGKAHIYKPKSSQQHTQKKLVGSLLDKAFRGSALSLMQHVLETKPTTREELAEIRRLIDEAEAKGGRK
jgi:BlaI family penicillinase repressor